VVPSEWGPGSWFPRYDVFCRIYETYYVNRLDFYSIWWAPEYGPRWCRIKQAPLAWDIRGGWATPKDYQNHGTKGGNVVYGDGHADWQEQRRWDQTNFPNPGGKYFPVPLP